jgi:hypothetical protein
MTAAKMRNGKTTAARAAAPADTTRLIQLIGQTWLSWKPCICSHQREQLQLDA